jgi:hypothetical protein
LTGSIQNRYNRISTIPGVGRRQRPSNIPDERSALRTVIRWVKKGVPHKLDRRRRSRLEVLVAAQ